MKFVCLEIISKENEQDIKTGESTVVSQKID
jgi:hypothetical protein